MVKNISCIASLCCLSFIKHIYSETWCSVLCIFYSWRLYALYGVVSVSCESTYTFVIYIYGSIWVQEQIKQALVFVAIPYGLVMWDLPMGFAYWCPIYLAWLSDIHVALVSYSRQVGACVRDLADGLPSYLCRCRVC